MGAVVEERGVIHLGRTIKSKNSLARVEAVDILHTCLDSVMLSEWASPVKLKCVLGKGLLGVGALSSVGERAVEHVAE